jgi:hypothetical protein
MEVKIKEEPTDITFDGQPATRVLEGFRKGALHLVHTDGGESWYYSDGTSEHWVGEIKSQEIDAAKARDETP